MKVLQINKLYYPWIGGVEKVVQQIAEGLNEKTDMTVLACVPKGKGRTDLVNGVKLIFAGSLGILFSMPISLSFPFIFRRESRRSDIVLFHMPFPLADLSCLLFKPKAKILVWWHSDIIKQKAFMFLYGPIMKMFLRKAEKIVVATEKHISSSKYLSEYKSKCVEIPFGVDLKKYSMSDAVRHEVEQIRKKHNKPILLFVGRLVYYKGIEYLVRAMKDVDAVLLIAGEGKLRDELQAIADKSGITGKIEFLGRIDDRELLNYYHAADIFVFPSVANTEAFGLVQIEAMACGKPVISTNLPTGAGSINVHGETGLLVPVKDAKALSSAINELLGSGELRLRMGKNARERVEKEYSLDKMLQKVLDLFLRSNL